jgi:chromate reductase
MAEEMTILGLAGSLRRASYNRGALRAAERLAPEGVHVDVFDLRDIPMYNQDLESEMPAMVSRLKERVRAADAVLLATPEYNYSVPAVLKNAIDWASRPYGDNSWQGKPVAVMGASISGMGSIRAQYHLRQMFVFLDMHAVNRPEVMIGNASERFDAEGNLINEQAASQIQALLRSLVQWTRRLQGRAMG